jgi:large conductance mechanosensitive channel
VKGFRDFILRGNVVDLAIAVAIGAAFVALIDQFGKSFIQPMVKVFSGGGVSGGTFVISKQTFDYGAMINAIITFLITAAVIYFFIVVPVNKLMERYYPKKVEPGGPTELDLLAEIRDSLRR